MCMAECLMSAIFLAFDDFIRVFFLFCLDVICFRGSITERQFLCMVYFVQSFHYRAIFFLNLNNVYIVFVNLATNHNGLHWCRRDANNATNPFEKKKRILQWKSHFLDYIFLLLLSVDVVFLDRLWLCNLQCLLNEIITATKQRWLWERAKNGQAFSTLV